MTIAAIRGGTPEISFPGEMSHIWKNLPSPPKKFAVASEEICRRLRRNLPSRFFAFWCHFENSDAAALEDVYRKALP
jgi:hypothetical protein